MATTAIQISYEMPPHTLEQIKRAREVCARLPSFLFSLRRLLAGHMDDNDAVKAALLAIIESDGE